MTQQSAIQRTLGTFQGLQAMQGEQQRQQAVGQQMEMQTQQQQMQAQQAEQERHRQEQLQRLRQQFVSQEDPRERSKTLGQIFQMDPEGAEQAREYLQVTTAEDQTRAVNQATALRRMIDENPERALSWLEENQGSLHPAMASVLPEMRDGDYEAAKQELGFGVTLIGGPDMYEQFAGIQEGPSIGQYNPRDYTVDSFAEFVRTNDPSVLQRYSAQRSVDIGGVPHVFDPSSGQYVPAQIGQGQEPGRIVERPGSGEPTAQSVEEWQPPEQITVDTVANFRSILAQAEEEARLPARLLQSGLRLNEQSGEMEVVPGSQLARQIEQDDETAQRAQEMAGRSGRTVVQDLGRAIEMVDGSMFASGAPARLIPNFINRPAQRLQSMVDSIESNISVNSLNEMRASSPTGGALGNVSDKQSALLAGLLGNMDITQAPEDLRENMKRVQNIFMDIIHGPGQGPERNRLAFDHMGRRVDGGVEWTGDPRLIEVMREDGQIPGMEGGAQVTPAGQSVPQQTPAQQTMNPDDADAFIQGIIGGQ